MASQLRGPRKQRTRQHVIADLSVHHLEGFILDAGHTAQRLSSDYGYDLVMFTYDGHGYLEPGSVFIQLKASDAMDEVGTNYVFDLDVRDYNLWMREQTPVILVLFDATRRRAFWLPTQEYFRDQATRQPRHGAKSVRVRIPIRHRVNSAAIVKMRELKQLAFREKTGAKR